MTSTARPEWLDEALARVEARLELRPFDARIAAERRRFSNETRWQHLKRRFRLEPHLRADFVTPTRTQTGGQTP